MSRLYVFLFLAGMMLIWGCTKETMVEGKWKVQTRTQKFPFTSEMQFNGDNSFLGISDAVNTAGIWRFDRRSKGDYLTVGIQTGDTLVFGIERLGGNNMELSIAGFSFTNDYATLKK
jgi:hypothetical protein